MNLAALENQVWKLLDDDGTYYPESAVRGALNEAQRFFCLLTLCLEATATLSLSANMAFYRAREAFPDWLLPRRLVNSDGQRLRRCSLSDLDAVNRNWQATSGIPQRYALAGLDFLAIYRQPPAADYLTAVYARAPRLLVNPTDVPEIRENSQYALPNYAAYALRQVEGGQEFAKFQSYFRDFMDEAQQVKKLVKGLNDG